MTELSLSVSSTRADVRAGTAALALLALTSLHHGYGAVIYETPWRLHVVYAAISAALAIVAALYASRTVRRDRLARAFTWLAAVIILGFPVVLIGFYEGGYNHLVKDALYFASGEAAARSIFPAPTYEMPNDLLFEVTGVAQFPLAVAAAVLTLGVLRETR